MYFDRRSLRRTSLIWVQFERIFLWNNIGTSTCGIHENSESSNKEANIYVVKVWKAPENDEGIVVGRSIFV